MGKRDIFQEDGQTHAVWHDGRNPALKNMPSTEGGRCEQNAFGCPVRELGYDHHAAEAGEGISVSGQVGCECSINHCSSRVNWYSGQRLQDPT